MVLQALGLWRSMLSLLFSSMKPQKGRVMLRQVEESFKTFCQKCAQLIFYLLKAKLFVEQRWAGTLKH
jgi:hypothetical protein